jgi:hypothetical protein
MCAAGTALALTKASFSARSQIPRKGAPSRPRSDSRETAGDKAGVKQQDGDYGDGAQPVDLGSIMHNARQVLP